MQRLPVVVMLVLTGCVGELTGLDDDGMEMGSGSGSGSGTQGTPRVAATVDKATLTTENGRTETLTLTLTSVDGFAGPVNLVPTLSNGSTPLSAVTIDGPASMTLAAGASTSATYTLTLPSNTTGAVVMGAFQVAVSSSAGAQSVTSAVTINNALTIDYPANTGTAAAGHPQAGASITVLRGTVLKFKNSDSISHIIHGSGALPHEGTTEGVDGLPGRTYDVPTTAVAPGTAVMMGCHSHGTASYATYTVM